MCLTCPDIEALEVARWHSEQGEDGPYASTRCVGCDPVAGDAAWQKPQPDAVEPHVAVSTRTPSPLLWQVVVAHRPNGAPYGRFAFPRYPVPARAKFTAPVMCPSDDTD